MSMSKSDGQRSEGKGPPPTSSLPTPSAPGQADLPAELGELPADFGDRLLAWYRQNARDLPWRRTHDPYAILVSELMLQQTRVETVLDRYGRFLERFSDFAALAAADVDEVLAEWSGLGYYRRARSLHALARAVIEQHDGRLPDDLDSLRALPGIGPYTAAAVASICFGLPELAIDGNIARALCRLAAIEEDPKKSSVQRRMRDLTAAEMAAHPAGDFNQALMELGARICLPRSPRCGDCPVPDMCAARWLGIESQIPLSRRQPVREVREEALVAERDGLYFLVRGQRPGVLQDMWELPTLDSRLELESLDAYMRQQGWPFERGELLGEIQHGISDRRITCSIYRGRLLEEPPELTVPEISEHVDSAGIELPGSDALLDGSIGVGSDIRTGWFTLSDIAALPLAASARKTFEKVLRVGLTRG
jgi:A/G-specific adenine glycosylase